MNFTDKEIKLIYYCLDYNLNQLESYIEDEENPIKSIQCLSLMDKIESLLGKIKNLKEN